MEVISDVALMWRDISNCRMSMFHIVPIHESREPPAGMFEVLEVCWIAGGVLHRLEKKLQ